MSEAEFQKFVEILRSGDGGGGRPIAIGFCPGSEPGHCDPQTLTTVAQ
jgi:hypothetical protein